MTLLAIETSCDETSAAIISKDGQIVINQVLSQIRVHQKFGGVVPEIAARKHTESINAVIASALSEAGISFSDLTHIAVTVGPGLEGALLIGAASAKVLASVLQIPLIPVNHLAGHIYSNFAKSPYPEFPFICLIVSGGHTILLKADGHFQFEILGQTKDDAAGEAFDKVSKVLGFAYPGGPEIEKQAQNGDPFAFQFPIPMRHDPSDFSFSGLKTAVIQQIKSLQDSKLIYRAEDICASFQRAVIKSLLDKTIAACLTHRVRHLCLCGGVTANQALSNAFSRAALENDLILHIPERLLCTDNAGMIGLAAYYAIQSGRSFLNQPVVSGRLKL